MTYKEVFQMVSTIPMSGTENIPCAYYQFPEGTAQECPFICFYFNSSSDLAADDTNYQKIRPLVIELYTNNKDFATEAAIESKLNDNGLVYAREEIYIDTEHMYMVTYMTEIVITEEINNGEN